MRILKAASLLLDYPCSDLVDARAALAEVIARAREISPERRAALLVLLDDLTQGDLLDAQERYDGLFDRGRHLSLLLFEHVHGESRDRGQAMVDLLAHYQSAGFELTGKELPDHIPLYLEFLSTRAPGEAREGLAEVSHLLVLLADRLDERRSPYAAVFLALLQIAGHPLAETTVREAAGTTGLPSAPANASAVRATAGAAMPSDCGHSAEALAALDRLWEEEQVSFLAAGGDACGSTCESGAHWSQAAPRDPSVPVHWVDFDRKNGAVSARS